MKKVLLIGFQRYDDKDMYPHLRYFIDELSNHCVLDYYNFKVRHGVIEGLLEHITKRPFRILSYGSLLIYVSYLFLDLLKLAFRKKDYNVIIAADYIAYIAASNLFRDKRIIFWSFDFIGDDHPFYNNFVIRFLIKLCSKAVAKEKRVIIQDADRLKLLLKSLKLDDIEIDTFYMPVSLNKVAYIDRKLSSFDRPRLLQCGGIGAYRSSDRLLEHYQTNYNHYRLYFHGYLFGEIERQLNSSEMQPIVSIRRVEPRFIYQIIEYCDIGFISYEATDLNHYYISKASGQLVEFLRVGLPVIAMGRNNLRDFTKQENIGVWISDINELNLAIDVIKANYEFYSNNSINCFNKYFNQEYYIPPIMEWLF